MATEGPKFELALKVGEFKLWDYTAWFLLTGPVTQTRYNPPWIPWFLRRNEVIVLFSGGV